MNLIELQNKIHTQNRELDACCARKSKENKLNYKVG